MKENSAWKYNLAIIQRYILANSNGHTSIDVEILKKELKSEFPNGITDEEQSTLCIEQCITNKRSFSVYALMSEGEQYAIRRMDMIAQKFKIDDKAMRVGRVMLELSDKICSRLEYRRYELGVPKKESLIYPKQEELKKNPMYFTEYEVVNILKNYNLDSNSIQMSVFGYDKPMANLGIYERQLSGPLEWYPLYDTKSGYLVLSPYALLLCAYSFFYKSILKNIGKEKFEESYSRICLEEIAIQINHCLQLRGIKEYPDIKCMVYQLDIEKYINFTFVSNVVENTSLDVILEPNDTSKQLTIRIAECVNRNEKLIKDTGNVDTVVNIIVLCGPKTFRVFSSELVKHSLVFTIDQLECIISLLDNELCNLHYFYLDKKEIEFLPINNDFEKFGFYYKHGMTFYVDDDIAIPMGIFISGNPLLEDIYKLLWEKDEHVEYIYSRFEPVKHLADFADEIPLYINSINKDDGSFLLVKLQNVNVLMFYSFKDTYRQISAQISKSIGVWLYVIETKFNIQILKRSITIFVNIIENGQLKVSRFNGNELRIDIPVSDIKSLNIDEHSIVSALCMELMKDGLTCREFTTDHIEKVFIETKSHFLFAESEGSITELDDGLKDCMTVSKRYNDIVLRQIEEYFKWNQKGVKHNISDSKQMVIDILGFLNQQLKPLLEQLSNREVLVKLFELHHSQLFWLSLTNGRYKYYKRIYDYLGIQEYRQHAYEQRYQETNALCKWIIEQIVLNQPYGNEKLKTIDDIYYAFSIAHQIEVFSTFMDILNNTFDENDGIEILKNGRIAKLSAIDDINKYLIDFETEQFYEQERLVEMGSYVPEYEVNPRDENFKKAFQAEYNISYSDYEKIITRSIELTNDKDFVIADFEELEFIDYVFNNGVGAEKYSYFKESFMLYGELALQIGKDKKYNYSDTYITRHNRKLEIATRPWIIYDGHVIYSYKSIYRSPIVLFNRISKGRLSCSSYEMTTFERTVNDHKGKAFNKAVFGFLDTHMQTADVKKEIKVGPHEILINCKDIGDFDLLLKDDSSKKIVCIELKDFIEFRTPYEFLNSIKAYDEKLVHVYDRCEWVKNEKMQFKKIYPTMDESYTVKHFFLTHHKSSHKYFTAMEYGIIEISLLDIMDNPSVLFE